MRRRRGNSRVRARMRFLAASAEPAHYSELAALTDSLWCSVPALGLQTLAICQQTARQSPPTPAAWDYKRCNFAEQSGTDYPARVSKTFPYTRIAREY